MLKTPNQGEIKHPEGQQCSWLHPGTHSGRLCGAAPRAVVVPVETASFGREVGRRLVCRLWEKSPRSHKCRRIALICCVYLHSSKNRIAEDIL